MPVKDGREYRSFEIENFKENKDSFIVEGYATTFGEPYDMGNGHFEQIDPHALDKADLSDVIFQLNHEGAPLARLRNNTLKLQCDAHGLKVEADLSGCQAGRDVFEGIKNGLIDRMSWGFTVAEDGWEYDAATKTSTITKVQKVYDVSAVSIPANGGTEIHARSYFDGVIEKECKEFALRMDRQQRARIKAALTIY